MSLTTSEKKEIEILIRKEIKDFFDSNSAKQFEKKLLDKISDDMSRGNLKKKCQRHSNKIVSRVLYGYVPTKKFLGTKI